VPLGYNLLYNNDIFASPVTKVFIF